MNVLKDNIFGIFLKEKRQEAGMSLRELAYSVDVAHTYILNIENGIKAPPSDLILKRIAIALNFDTQTSEILFDLAAKCKQMEDNKNIYLPTDISEYLHKTESAKATLREVKELGYGNEFWIKILKQLKNK